jgi:hypothetical protein
MRRPRRSFSLRFGLFFKGRPTRGEPGIDVGWVALGRPDRGLLDGPVQAPEETIDVGWVIAHPKRALEHDRDPWRGPNRAVKSKGLGTLGEESGNLGTLRGAEARGWARGNAPTQGLAASFPRPLQPLADRPLGHPQCRRDRALLPALLGQVPCSEATPFAPIGGRFGRRCRHRRPTSTSQATFTKSWWDQ